VISVEFGREMRSSSFLIVGAGAMGMACGYHLGAGGHRITYLVRRGRISVFSPPQRLYSYDDGKLRTFSGYEVIEDAGVEGRDFDWVLLTLDGATARTEQGMATLKQLGEALRASAALFLVGGVGIGLREHVIATTGLPEARVLCGAMMILCHQTSADLPVQAPTDPILLSQAAFAFRHMQGRVGFLLAASPRAAAKRFAAEWGQCGVSHCRLIHPLLYQAMTSAGFPMFVASEIAGWPEVDTLVAQRDLWALATSAVREIAGLPGNGWPGWLMSRLFTPGLHAFMQRKVEEGARPLNYQAFNRFHHGGKVLEQDLQILRNSLAYGREHGRSMTALTELLDRYEDAQAR
jgi:hypothetical protein